MATGVRTKSKGNVTLSEQEADEEQKIDRLMALIDEGNTPGVRQFILDEQALGVNLADETGQTAVHRAINFTPESVNILNILISNGALVDVPDDNGKRPIERGIEYGDAVLRCVEILLEQKQADGTRTVQLLEKNPKTGNSLLHWAAWTGNACMMKALLETGAFAEHLEEINAQGQTAMHVAAFRSPKQVVELLKDAGAQTNAVEKNARRLSRETPLMMAESMGRKDNAEYLLSLGAAVDTITFASKMKKIGKGKA